MGPFREAKESGNIGKGVSVDEQGKVPPNRGWFPHERDCNTYQNVYFNGTIEN